eukprot:364473-Chlamydomonas_euryale.AAC.3
MPASSACGSLPRTRGRWPPPHAAHHEACAVADVTPVAACRVVQVQSVADLVCVRHRHVPVLAAQPQHAVAVAAIHCQLRRTQRALRRTVQGAVAPEGKD